MAAHANVQQAVQHRDIWKTGARHATRIRLGCENLFGGVAGSSGGAERAPDDYRPGPSHPVVFTSELLN